MSKTNKKSKQIIILNMYHQATHNYVVHKVKSVENQVFEDTRSCAALRAADLDQIIGPGYSLGGYIL